jgi:ABC-type glycerol-3-phosphate transport system substrate-binding protein
MWAKDILATIMTQAGGSVTRRDENNELVSGFVNRTGQSGNPNESALRFFTEFSDSSKEDYSWNNSLPNSRAAFTAGNLALYIGYASEADLLRNANPNLSMGIAPLPQVREAKRALTMARVYGIALTRTGKNTQGAAVTALALAQAYPSSIFAQAFGVVSARRDVLSRGGEGHYSLFASSTIASFSWVDPHPRKTDSLFGDMIDSVVSGSARISEAITRADQEMKSALDL